MAVTAIHRGLKEKLLDALVSTSDTKGASFALPSSSSKKMLTWQTYFATTAPGAVSIQLQVALEDTDALYSVLDTSTSVDGETRSVDPQSALFVRARQVSRTGASSYTTVQLVCS